MKGRLLTLAAAAIALAVLLLLRGRERDGALSSPNAERGRPEPDVDRPIDPRTERVPLLAGDVDTSISIGGEEHVSAARTPQAATKLGALEGRIRTDDGFALPGVRIQAFEAPEREVSRDATSLSDGRFSFSGLAAGATYRLVIDPGTLPKGILAPPEQSYCIDSIDRSLARMHATCVQLPENGGEALVELTAWRAARVEGRLLGSRREPVPDTPVRLDSRPGSARTDAEGRFVFEDVFPGELVLRAFPDRASEWYALPRPEVRFTIRPAELVVLPDLVFVPGPASIEGRVIDQDGAPVAGLVVLCGRDPGSWFDVLLIGGTGTDGTFRLEKLPAEPVRVHVGPTGYTGYEDLLVTHPGPSFQLDLGHTPAADLGTIRVERDRPFVLRGKIDTNPVDRTSTRFQLDASFTGGPLEPIRIEPRSLAFEYRTLRSEEPFTLVLTVRGSKARFPVQPIPDGEDEIVLPYPAPR